MANKFGIGGVVLGVVLVIGLIGGVKSYNKIDAGNAGVVYNWRGGIEDKALTQGVKFISPWKHVTQYPISTETVFLSKAKVEGSPGDDSFNVSTREGKQVNMDARYAYHMDIEKLPKIFTKFRGASVGTIEGGYLKTALQSTIQEVTSAYGVLDIYGAKRDEITIKVSDKLKALLEKDGIIIESFSFGEIRPDATTLEAIQENVNAQQKLATLQVQKQQASAEAERLIIEAEGKAAAAVAEAQGQAKANLVIKQSLTPELIQMEIAKKWNGTLPTVTGGSTPMIQLPSATK